MWNLKKLLLAVLILLLLGAVIIGGWIALQYKSEANTPPASAEIQFERAQEFSALVSFTDTGFEPSETRMLQNQTARFINNSGSDLWVEGVASADNPAYPDTSDCGASSSFDSCKVLEPGDIWEFNFDTAGTWLFRNKENKTQVGVIYVQQEQL